MAHTLLGRSCILCFETVLGMNKIIPTPFPPPKNKKVFQKNFFHLMIFLKNLFKGVGGVSYPIFNKFQYGARFAGEKLFEIF